VEHGPAAAALAGYVGRAAASSTPDPAARSAPTPDRSLGPSGSAGEESLGLSCPGARESTGTTDRAERGPVGSSGPAERDSGGSLGPSGSAGRESGPRGREPGGRADGSVGGDRISETRPWATAVRTLALWCADWPLVAAGVAPDEPAVVLHGGRTVACTPAARAEGVHRGMRRRDAEARCPHLVVLAHDPARDARAFEPVVAAIETFVPRVELTRPGLCSVATRGPSRYYGGDEALAARLVAAVREVLGAGGAHVGAGVADGTFAASLAARATAGGAPVLVLAEGGTPAFLADLPVSALSDPVEPAGSGGRAEPAGSGGRVQMADLASLLVRLGLRTLGAVAALPETDVVARFGAEGGRAWRRANGLDDRPLDARDPSPDLVAEVVLDPPADRVDTAAFAARTLAADLHERLERQGLACTRLIIEARTTDGERLSRVWRHEGRFTPGATAERVRWQLDGWLTTGARAAQQSGEPGARTARAAQQSGEPGARAAQQSGEPGARAAQQSGKLTARSGIEHEPGDVGGRAEGGGLTLLRLVPDEVVAGGGRQLGFWGGDAEADERAARALARVQGLLGPAAVVTAVASGGREPRLRATLVPWGDPREPAHPGGQAKRSAIELGPAVDRPEEAERPVRRPKSGMGAAAGEVPPWPGRIPGPPPAVVPVKREPAEVVDAAGIPVTVSGRGLASAAPARVAWPAGTLEVAGWAGPWPVEERWWDPATATRLARIQVTASDGTAVLLACDQGQWWLEATYD